MSFMRDLITEKEDGNDYNETIKANLKHLKNLNDEKENRI